MSEEKCPRCGTPLKTVEVRIPIYVTDYSSTHPIQRIVAYEDRTELSDCVRCTGSY